jgi:hypothetical protein
VSELRGGAVLFFERRQFLFRMQQRELPVCNWRSELRPLSGWVIFVGVWSCPVYELRSRNVPREHW